MLQYNSVKARRALFAAVSALLAILGLACGQSSCQPVAANGTASYTPPSADWCARIHGGPHGSNEPAIDLSAANAGIRFFGVEASLATVDQALAKALTQPGQLSVEAALPRYANALRGVCAVAADNGSVPAARVELIGQVALVYPGTGLVVLPAGAEAVAIDLRNLPAISLRKTLDAAVAPALARPVARAMRIVRRRKGMDDEVIAPGKNVYSNDVTTVYDDSIPATGTRELPIIFLTGATMAPEAAELAGTLRLRGQAWIFGEDVLASVAESEWTGIGDRGLAWRSSDLLLAQNQRWPDVIPADLHLTDADLLRRLARVDVTKLGVPPAVMLLTGSMLDQRPRVEAVPSVPFVEPDNLGIGELRAALIIAHGALRMWFPYFDIVGDRIDKRLLETLASAAALPTPIERKQAARLLRRLGEAVHDGHSFVVDALRKRDATAKQTILGLVIDVIDDEPIVVRSAAEGIEPGDTLVAIGDQPVADYYKDELPCTSAATKWYRYKIANRGLLHLEAPTVITLRSPKGVVRKVTVAPATEDDVSRRLGGAQSMRYSGFLGDLGAKDIYYLNLSSEVLKDDEAFRATLTAARNAAGLVLDVRGYPEVNHYEVAMRTIPADFSSPIFRTLVRTGTSHGIESLDDSRVLEPMTSPSYGGPIILLVGPGTVSAAENFATMLVGANRVTVVGRTSAGTNGNITGVQLPGGLGFTFTGMAVMFPDGRAFHGAGIVPDVEVKPTATDYAAGRDVDLLQAIEVLRRRADRKH